LRPVEVNRLKVKDINLEESLLYFQAKNKPLKIKRIPSIFIDDIKSLNLHLYNAEHFLFTPKNEPSEWNSSDNSRRDTFSKRFKIVKNKFNLGSQYGLYSFRHSFITNLFRYLRSVEKKSYSEAIEVLQPITGHETRVALERYIHQIDADIPEDWSDKIDFIL
jgi:integrase